MNGKKRTLSPKSLSILIGVLGFVVLIGGVLALVMPQKQKAAQLGKDIATTQTQIATARAAAAPTPQQVVRVANLFKLGKAMPDQTDMTGIILQLQKTATEAGVEFDSIQPGTAASGTGYSVQPLELAFNGSFFKLTNFLSRLRGLVTVRHGALDANGRLFSVTGINFGPGASGFPEIAANVSVNAYVYGGAASGVPGLPPTAVAPGTTTTTTTPPPASPAVASGATH